MADLIFVFDQRTHCTIVTEGAFNPAIWAFVDKVAGVTAYVDSILLPQDSARGNLTLYINYLNSSTANNFKMISKKNLFILSESF